MDESRPAERRDGRQRVLVRAINEADARPIAVVREESVRFTVQIAGTGAFVLECGGWRTSASAELAQSDAGKKGQPRAVSGCRRGEAFQGGRSVCYRLARAVLWLFLVGMLLATGCSRRDGLVRVRGVVTLDGRELDKGRIQFRKIEGDQRAFHTLIENGAYQLDMQPGSMSVEIMASRLTGRVIRMGNDIIPVGKQYLPARYNDKTELTAEISQSANEFSFDLTSE